MLGYHGLIIEVSVHIGFSYCQSTFNKHFLRLLLFLLQLIFVVVFVDMVVVVNDVVVV